MEPQTATADAVIVLRSVRRDYYLGDQLVRALDGVDLDITRNDYVAITGVSGFGKSTMMNIVGCLDRPTRGEYFLNGRAVAHMSENELAAARNGDVGFVFQSFNLLPRANALQNVMQPLMYRKLPLSERRALAEQSLRCVGVGERMHHLPNQLSGGQHQRVAVARALVSDPAILLADEPTGNLDSTTTTEIMALFDQLHADGRTIVIVTHEAEIADHCRRVVRLCDGRVESDVHKELG